MTIWPSNVTSRTPRATSSRHSATMSSMARLRSSPRVWGTMQKVQCWLQPCMMLTKAVTGRRLAGEIEDVLADLRLAAGLVAHVADLRPPAGQQVVHVFGRAMELLRAQDQADAGGVGEQFVAAALRHATEVPSTTLGTLPPRVGGERRSSCRGPSARRRRARCRCSAARRPRSLRTSPGHSRARGTGRRPLPRRARSSGSRRS